MPSIRAGHIVAFYLFDVAETVDLQAVPTVIGGPAVAARLAPKSATPAYVQYENPPVSFDGELVGAAEVNGLHARFRLYDYGVISLAMSRPFAGTWSDLVSVGQTLIENDDLEQQAQQLCRRTVERLRPALTGVQSTFLSEDYLVYAVTELDRPMSARDLLVEHGDEIALMLRGERQALSTQERRRILRHRISYLADDLVVPTWNAALVYDRPSGVQATLEILEFANSQLLEFRYYDRRLDNELAAIYTRLQRGRWHADWFGGRYTKAARQVHALFIEFNELSDRTENTLKFVGDVYAARLFALVGERLGLDAWKANVREKLKTLDDIYRFAVEQSSMSRGTLLELAVVLILVLELALVLVGVMK